MKKIAKLFAVAGMMSLLISFVGCDMATEADLVGTNPQTTVPATDNTSPADTEKESDDSEKGEKTSKPTTGNSSSDTTSLWHMFDGADMQVWEKTATLEETEEGLEITIGDKGWWGMCFCNDGAVGVADGAVTFDMSNIKTVKFDAKASKKASIWVSASDSQAAAADQAKVTLSTEFETKSYTYVNTSAKDYGVLDIGGGDLGTTTESDVVITIRNIRFFDADGNETVPTRNE